jgi:hypothetical protein
MPLKYEIYFLYRCLLSADTLCLSIHYVCRYGLSAETFFPGTFWPDMFCLLIVLSPIRFVVDTLCHWYVLSPTSSVADTFRANTFCPDKFCPDKFCPDTLCPWTYLCTKKITENRGNSDKVYLLKSISSALQFVFGDKKNLVWNL